jgi:hypothetical protein
MGVSAVQHSVLDVSVVKCVRCECSPADPRGRECSQADTQSVSVAHRCLRGVSVVDQCLLLLPLHVFSHGVVMPGVRGGGGA